MSSSKQPDLMDVLRFGESGAQLKSQINPNKWRKIVKLARKKGYTVEGLLSDTPPALKERSPHGLAVQARKTARQAYKPALQSLNIEERRVKALADKRASDDKYYREWLVAQGQTLDAQARAADGALLDRQREIGQQSSQAWDETQAAAQATAAATAGNVSDVSQSTALNDKSAAQRGAALIASQRETSSQLIGSGERQAAYAAAQVLAGASAVRAQRRAEENKSLAEIRGERKTLRSERGAATSQELARLRDAEVGKAESQRDYAAAAAQLGLDKQGQKLDWKKYLTDLRLKKRALTLEEMKAQHAQLVDAAKLKLEYDKIVSREGLAAANEKLQRYIQKKLDGRDANNADGAGGPTSTEKNAARDLYLDVEAARGLMDRLNREHPEGYINRPGEDNDVKFRDRLRNEGVSDALIDIVNDLRDHGGKLSPAGYAKAKALGVAKFYDRV